MANLLLNSGATLLKSERQPTPITYLTQWKIVGNSEVHGNEIWSCGEYNSSDGKYHILVQPQGGNIVDIALDEPLRKVNDVADTIEFPSGTEGKALVTRLFGYVDLGTLSYSQRSVAGDSTIYRYSTTSLSNVIKSCLKSKVPNLLSVYPAIKADDTYKKIDGIGVDNTSLFIYDSENNQLTVNEFKSAMNGIRLIYELATPTTELVDAPQIAEADSYSCIISQGAKAVSWSSFDTE